jgi:AcrR family transcriptional regulator
MTTRDRILDATKQVIEERGSARVTTKEIARAAGLAEGTLFKYFERKDDLLLAVVQENLPPFLAVTHPERAGSRTLAEHLEAIAQAAMTYYAQLIPLMIAICGDAALLARHREWMQAQQAGPQRIYERVAAYIAAEQRLGRLNAQRDPMSVAALLLGPSYQYAFLRYFMGADPLPLSDRQFVSGLVQTLMEGVASRGV